MEFRSRLSTSKQKKKDKLEKKFKALNFFSSFLDRTIHNLTYTNMRKKRKFSHPVARERQGKHY